MKRALITGIAGQDGSYLAELLLSKQYEVFGIIRRNSVPEHQESRIAHLGDKVTTFYGDLTDIESLTHALRESQPDEVYNLAAQSHVRISFDVPSYTFQVNALGAANMLQAVRPVVPEARYYQASSSEMFGNAIDADGFQRLTTPMHPTSPYGCAKLFAYNLTRHFRRAHGMFAVNGVLFNHESPRRGSNFVTAKVCKAAASIAHGKADSLTLGNLDSKRDWGHSRDYVRAMWLMLQQTEPDDWLIATGESHSVRDLCRVAFEHVGLDYLDFVRQDERYMRPEELHCLRGDATHAREYLGWKPEMDFESTVREIVDEWRDRIT